MSSLPPIAATNLTYLIRDFVVSYFFRISTNFGPVKQARRYLDGMEGEELEEIKLDWLE